MRTEIDGKRQEIHSEMEINMDELILKEILEALDRNEKAALVTLTGIKGSTPRDEGSLMLVREDGRILGSIGGGKIEYAVIQESVQAIRDGKSREFEHSLTPNGDLGMQCGGEAKGFIKVFSPEKRLVIAGGGHVGEKVLELATFLGFKCTVIDDREEYRNRESLKKANRIIIAPYEKAIEQIEITDETYIVIATKGHVGDLEFVKNALRTDAKYIGLIGSKAKHVFIRKALKEEGFSDEQIAKIYGPVGLDISNQLPEEIAVSIMSEILLIKNSGSLKHRKDILKER